MTKSYLVRDDQIFVIENNADEDVVHRIKMITMLRNYLDSWNLESAPQLAEKVNALLDEPQLWQGLKRVPLKGCEVQTAIAKEISDEAA
jgi:hypothetical protein